MKSRLKQHLLLGLGLGVLGACRSELDKAPFDDTGASAAVESVVETAPDDDPGSVDEVESEVDADADVWEPTPEDDVDPTELMLLPAEANQLHDLSCRGLPDDDDGTGTWSWSVDGVATTHVEPVLAAAHTRAGEHWSCTYTTSEGDTYVGGRELEVGFTQIAAGYLYGCGIVPVEAHLPGDVLCWAISSIVEAPASQEGAFTHVIVDGNSWAPSVRALDETGRVSVWSRESAQPDGPDEPLVSLSNAEGLTCGLRTDGTGVCWSGSNTWISTDTDPSLRFTHLVSVGDDWSDREVCGILEEDQSVACFELRLEWVEMESPFLFDDGSQPFVDISVGLDSMCALTDRGLAHCHGYRDEVVDTGGVRQLAVYGWGAAGLTGSGHMVGWWFLAGLTGPAKRFTQIAAGDYFVLLLDDQGNLFADGNVYYPPEHP